MTTPSIAGWIKSFFSSLSSMQLDRSLRNLGITWNGRTPVGLIEGLLAGLWMRARSISQAVQLAPLIGREIPKKGIYRFLNQRTLDLRFLLRSYFTAETTTADDVLLLDDTPSKRTGYQLPGISFLYSTTQKASILGYGLVTLFHYGAQRSGFLDFEVKLSDVTPSQAHRRGRPINEILHAKRKTRFDLALEMLDRVRDLGNRARILIFDGWYGKSVDFLWEIIRRHFHFITRLRINRYLWFKGEYRQISTIFRKAKKLRRFNDKTKYRAWLSNLPQFGEVWAILVKFRDKTGNLHKAVVISDLLDWTPERILERYLDRAKIEQGYKVTKQDLGLNDAHLRTFAGQINEMALTLLAYLLASQVRLGVGGTTSVAGVLLQARQAWFIWARIGALQDLWRRARKYSPETRIRAGLFQSWIEETMMATAPG